MFGSKCSVEQAALIVPVRGPLGKMLFWNFFGEILLTARAAEARIIASARLPATLLTSSEKGAVKAGPGIDAELAVG